MLSSLLLDKEKQILRTLETDDYTHLLLNIERWNKPGRKLRKKPKISMVSPDKIINLIILEIMANG